MRGKAIAGGARPFPPNGWGPALAGLRWPAIYTSMGAPHPLLPSRRRSPQPSRYRPCCRSRVLGYSAVGLPLAAAIITRRWLGRFHLSGGNCMMRSRLRWAAVLLAAVDRPAARVGIPRPGTAVTCSGGPGADRAPCSPSLFWSASRPFSETAGQQAWNRRVLARSQARSETPAASLSP